MIALKPKKKKMSNQQFNIFCRFVFILGIILALTACNGRPKGVLGQSKMTDVLTELHKLDGCLNEKGYQYGHYPDKAPYYKFILKKYDITQAQFDSSLVWYTKNPKQFEKVYANVLINLNNEKDVIASSKYHPVDSAALAKMKINLWNKRKLYNFTKDSTRTRLDFEIKDNNLLLGDVYVLRFLQRIAPEDSCKKQHVVLRINYTNGKCDSAYTIAHHDSLLRRYTLRLPALKKLKIKSISGELLGSKTYKGKFHAMLDSITLTREFNGLKQDSLRKIVEKADSILNVKKNKLRLDSISKTILSKKKSDSIINVRFMKTKPELHNKPMIIKQIENRKEHIN